MAKALQRRTFRLRRIFRWCRIVVWFVLLAIILAGIYLNTVGLPEFLKRPLVAKLRESGVQVEFDRMRLRWYRGIVVDHATFTFLKHPLQPHFSSAETELNPDLKSLRDSRLKLNSIAIKEGTFFWPVSKTNDPALIVSNITTRIEFHAGDKIDVNQLDAYFANTKIVVAGSVTNASAMRAWKMFHRKPPGKGKGGLEKFAALMQEIQLPGAPELKVQLDGDGVSPQTFKTKLSFTAPTAQTPWGNGTNLQFTAELRGATNSAAKNVVRLKAGAVATKWVSASSLNCVANLSLNSTNADHFLADLKISAKQVRSKTERADSLRISARAPLAFTNLVLTRLDGLLFAAGAETKWGNAASAEIAFSAQTNSAPKMANADWAAWRLAEPFAVDWKANLSNVDSPKLKIDKFSCAGTWRAPEVRISELKTELYEGKAAATAQLNVATREVHAKASSDFDVQKISPLLTPFGQRWIAKFTWETPPQLNGTVSAVLPAWTNRSPNWRADVLPTLHLQGHVEAGNGSYRGVTVTAAKTDFVFSNQVWTLPHLWVDRPEGGADLQLVADDRAKEYHWKVNSRIAPSAIRHLLTEKAQHVFDDFRFQDPPLIRADILGHWHELEDVAIHGDFVITNFSFRSNAVDKLSASLRLTNQVLSFTDLRLDRSDKFIAGDGIQLDFPAHRIAFTNVYGTVDPYLVTRIIGKKVAAHIAPYQFAETPAIRVDGSMSLTNINDVDMHFLVDGNQFRWKNFSADKVSGRLDWIDETLLLTNLHASAYHGGTVEGWAYFDFAPLNGTEFKFDLAAADVDLAPFINGLTGKTNHLEGLLHGQFTLESGNTRDPKTWRGYGRANLRDGLIWDVPIFGIFSPMLNALLPGAGNSRAREGSATYVIRDGIIYSDDLQVRAAGLRLKYRGAVNFEKQVDARVEAELLRDTWIIGPLVSLALSPISKIFEYKVTGTLSQPKSEPVYIPNILMMTLRPFHSIKEALTPEKNSSGNSEPSGSTPK